MVAHRDHAYRVKSVNSAPVERMLWPILWTERRHAYGNSQAPVVSIMTEPYKDLIDIPNTRQLIAARTGTSMTKHCALVATSPFGSVKTPPSLDAANDQQAWRSTRLLRSPLRRPSRSADSFICPARTERFLGAVLQRIDVPLPYPEHRTLSRRHPRGAPTAGRSCLCGIAIPNH